VCSECSALAVVHGRSSGVGIGDDEKALAVTAGVIPISGDTNLAILV
jgi:hypothetical protein